MDAWFEACLGGAGADELSDFCNSLRIHLASNYTDWWLGRHVDYEMVVRRRELSWNEVPGFAREDQNLRFGGQNPGLFGTFAMLADFAAVATIGNWDNDAYMDDEDGSHIAPEWMRDADSQEECGRILARALLKARHYQPVSKLVASIFVRSLQTFDYGEALHTSVCVRFLNRLAGYDDDQARLNAELIRPGAWPKGLPYDMAYVHVPIATLLNNAKRNKGASGRGTSTRPPDHIDLTKQQNTKTSMRRSHDPNCLTIILERWRQFREPSASLLSEWKLAVQRFITLHGDLSVTEIEPGHVRDYRDILKRLPARPEVKIRALPLAEQADWAEKNNLPTLSIASINKALTGIRVLLDYALEELNLISVNPASAVKSLVRKSSSGQSYKSFEDAELIKIFSSPAFTGCQASRKRYLAGDIVLKDHFYWLNYLGLYHGCRLEELGQLRLFDIRQDSGIWFMDICLEDGETSLKTASAIRKVPLHPQVIRKGFLDYVQNLPNSQHWLFDDLPGVTANKPTKEYSRSFGRYLDQIGIDAKGKVFHSYRHSFKTACRKVKMLPQLEWAIMGHSQKGMDKIYGDPYPLDVRHEAICQIRYVVDDL